MSQHTLRQMQNAKNTRMSYCLRSYFCIIQASMLFWLFKRRIFNVEEVMSHQLNYRHYKVTTRDLWLPSDSLTACNSLYFVRAAAVQTISEKKKVVIWDRAGVVTLSVCSLTVAYSSMSRPNQWSPWWREGRRFSKWLTSNVWPTLSMLRCSTSSSGAHSHRKHTV